MPAKSTLAEFAFERIEVPGKLRRHVRVDRRGTEALVFAPDWQHFRRERDGDIGQLALYELICCALVAWIEVRVEKADRDRLDPLFTHAR